MIGYLIYWLRCLLRGFNNVSCGMRRVPDYIIFTLQGEYPEIAPPPASFLDRYFSRPKPSLKEISQNFRTIGQDSRVKGVILHLCDLKMSFAQLQSLRDMVQELRANGKEVIAWTSNFDNANLYLASAADRILLQEGGSVNPLGLVQSFVFMAQALRKWGIQFDLLQISPYKSAGDRFTREDMSEEVKEMTNWLLDSNYQQFKEAIALSRGVDEEGAERLIDGSPYTDLEASEAGLIDDIVSREDLPVYLGTEEKPVVINGWSEGRKKIKKLPLPRPGSYVALLRVEGSIVDGESKRTPFRPPFPIPFLTDNTAGDLTITTQARKILKDRRAAAVVVFIDSGGGSATASEAMAQAFGKVAEKKPLIVSMGSVAASGGYYIATPASTIMAQPGTITGSIGVLGGKLVNAGLLDKLLFNREVLSRGENALYNYPGRPYTEEERQKAWDRIQRTYDLFLERVAKSRDMEREEVDRIGGGRVWTGQQALEHGLVTELGGLEKAINRAREMAQLPPSTPVREVGPVKQKSIYSWEPAAAFNEVLDRMRLFNRAGAMYLCPIQPEENGDF